jgi:hypothetical protein
MRHYVLLHERNARLERAVANLEKCQEEVRVAEEALARGGTNFHLAESDACDVVLQQIKLQTTFPPSPPLY